MRDIRTEIDQINEIVPFPAVAAEILAALRNDDIAAVKITKLVESDAALTTNILRAANAPFYGIRGHVNNVRSAITLIGLEETSRLLLTYHMKQRLIFLNMQQWGYGIGEQPDGFSIDDHPCWKVLTTFEPRFLEQTPFEVSQDILPEFEKSKKLLHLLV